MLGRPLLPTPDNVIAETASVKALAVVARMIISCAALSRVADKVADAVFEQSTARITIASKHAMDARANAISDVCC